MPLRTFENNELHFKIHTINYLVQAEDDTIAGPHSHNYYEMIWVTGGSGLLHADMQKYTLENNMLYCVKPGQVHWLQMSKDLDGYILSFPDSFLKLADQEFDSICPMKLCQLFSERVVVEIQKEATPEIREIVIKMANEFNNEYSFRTQILLRYFKIFLIYLIRHLENGLSFVKQTREIELAKSFMELLDKHFKEKKMVADYASMLLVTPNYLNGIVKKNTGFSAGHLIRQRVVLEAKRMGRYSDAGMKEIAYNLGFADSGHFSKFFKAVSGMNFTDFKKEGLLISLTTLGRAG